MIKDLFVNFSILNLFILFGGYILRDKKIVDKNSALKFKIITGLFGGLLGILIMIYTIEIKRGGTIIDLRFIAIIITFYYAGVISTFISGTIISIARVLIYGVNLSSITSIGIIIIIIISFIIISKFSVVKIKKWTIMHFSALIISEIGYFYLIDDSFNKYKIIAIYFLISTVSSGLVYIMIEYIMEINYTYQELKDNSTKDFLTGITNTREFNRKLIETISETDRNDETLGCIFLDIDYFKKVNDTYGHNSGDMVLKKFAKILIDNSRGKDIVARIGGEEFCIILPNTNSIYTMEVANRIINEIREVKFEVDNNKFIFITASAGVSIYNSGKSNIETLLKEADDALYKAKESGRNRALAIGI